MTAGAPFLHPDAAADGGAVREGTMTTIETLAPPADLELLLATLPPRVRRALDAVGDLAALLEVVLDLVRVPAARFPDREVPVRADEVTA